MKTRLRLAVAAAVLAAAVMGGWKWTSVAPGADEYPVPVIIDTSNQLQEVGANPADTVIDGWSWGGE